MAVPIGPCGQNVTMADLSSSQPAPDTAPDKWSNTNAIRCRRRRHTYVYRHAYTHMAVTEDIFLAIHNIQLLLLPVSHLDKDWEKALPVLHKHMTCGLLLRVSLAALIITPSHRLWKLNHRQCVQLEKTERHLALPDIKIPHGKIIYCKAQSLAVYVTPK